MRLHRKDLVASLVFVLVAMACIVTYKVVQISDKHRAEIQQAQTQAVLSKTKREIQGLRSVVKEQSNVILAARGVGLLNMSPGPWEPFEITFYTGQAGINGTGNGITFTGKHVKNEWTCAVDPKMIPLGSIIEVKFKDGSQQILQATDIGGMIGGNHIDVYDPSYADCVRRGGKQMGYVRILILGKGRSSQ